MNPQTRPLVMPFDAVGAADLPVVGGKGANLGVLASADLPVPPGFCVTTAAFDRFLAQDDAVAPMLAALDELSSEDVEGVREHAGRLREHLRQLPIPPDVEQAVRTAWSQAGESHAYAVRSSATLEDLPDASFAGQQDTYLEVRGAATLLARVRDCWASLFTDRAVLYRRQHGFASTAARLAVVVQRMVSPEVSGIMFTADPLDGHRGVCSIDASYGLGEALVSGLVDADLYRLDKRSGAALQVRVGGKAMAIRPRPEGGTEHVEVLPVDRERRCLSDEQLAALLDLARQVEALQGVPQDIEWGIEGTTIWLLQARPITSLFPIPRASEPAIGPRVYISFGHMQVNTAPMVPMTHSVFSHVIPLFRTGPNNTSQAVASAGGRLFIDLTPALVRWPPSKVLPKVLTSIDPGVGERLAVVVQRAEFQQGGAERAVSRRAVLGLMRTMMSRVAYWLWWARPERAREMFHEVIDGTMTDAAERLARAEPGAPRVREAKRLLENLFAGALARTHLPMFGAGMMAWGLLRRIMRGRVPAATIEALSRGLLGNLTTDMDLELGDLADHARSIPALAEHLRTAAPRTAIEGARSILEAEPFIAEWDDFIERYGHRGPGEIDISVNRWADDPSSLITSLVGMLGSAPGDHRRRHEAAIAEGEQAAVTIIEAAGGGLGLRRRLVRRLVSVVRAYLALREHGKFLAIRLMMLVRRAILEAADLAVEQDSLEQADDVWMLSMVELIELLEGKGEPDLRGQIQRRTAEQERYGRLSPPRVITSDGEQPSVPASETLGPGELGGLAASAGVVEGTARVVLDPNAQVLEAGEILVAPFTDPGWTPLFVHASGLVMEVGGLMTHGSVVAREYGLPAVVGVDGATTTIRTGQRIRVDGDRGRVTVLEDADA